MQEVPVVTLPQERQTFRMWLKKLLYNEDKIKRSAFSNYAINKTKLQAVPVITLYKKDKFARYACSSSSIRKTNMQDVLVLNHLETRQTCKMCM